MPSPRLLVALPAALLLAACNPPPAPRSVANDAPVADPEITLPAAIPSAKAGAPAPTGGKLGLRDALERMLRENLDLTAARHDLEATRADIIAAGVLTNPNVAVNGQWLLHGEPAQGLQSFNVVVDQVIPVGGQIGLRQEVARGLTSAAERDYAALLWTMSRNVCDAYLDLQTSQAKQAVLREAVADLERVVTIVTERAKAGANPVYDRARVQLEQADLRSQLDQSAADVATTRAALAQAIGRGIDTTTLEVDDLATDPPPIPERGEAVSAAVQRRQEIAAARLRAETADRRITQAGREYVPSPDVAVGYSGWFGVPTENGPKGGGALFAGVTIPIPLLDHGQGKVDRASSEAHAAHTRADGTELGIRREVEKSIDIMAGQLNAYRRYKETTAGQVAGLRTMAESAYKEGKATVMELLDAYRVNTQAKQREIDLRAAALRASLDVERAIGPRVKKQGN
jgi:cobalt-zinc-cadmium efflux system outer membrane protein